MIEVLGKLRKIEWNQFCSAVEEYSALVQKERELREKLFSVNNKFYIW